MEKIKILAVIDHLGQGGAEKQFINLVSNINAERFEPHVFIAERAGERLSELGPHIRIHGLTHSSKRKTFDAVRLLRKTLFEIKPAIIQTWLDYSTFISAVVLKLTSFNGIFVASHRVSIEELYNNEVRFGKIKKNLLVWANKQAQCVTTNSKMLVKQLGDYGISTGRLIYNGIDLRKCEGLPSRDELRKKLNMPANFFYIAFVGALVERKGLRFFIQAIRELKTINIKALIVGDGALRDMVKSLARNDERFFMVGYQPNALEYIKASDLLVLPSFYEGLPNVVMEAMAVGTPVIATNVYGIPELIEDGINGKLVPAKNSGSITDSIEFIRSNPAASAGFVEASRKKAQFFSIERMVKEYEELYSELVGSLYK
ncbi:MAG: glycosyltransferase [Nitrospirae bacterium]|nr:glycosyltransferase [Nitrospirota bacterium]